jgi:hypothetical protein
MISGQALLQTRTGEYEPTAASAQGFYSFSSRKPRFNRAYIPLMLTHPHIQLGLKIMRGRVIARSKFFVDEPNTEIRDYVIKQITRFWMFSANRMLMAIPWGYSGGEALYERQHGLTHFKMVKNFHPIDIRVVTDSLGQKTGISVRRVPGSRSKVYLGGPKSLWHVQNREDHPWYGSSGLFGAYDPWYESWKDGGARDTRNLYFYKYAFTGESLYFPPGATPSNNVNVPMRDNRDVAREIVEKRRTGGIAVFPNQTDEHGNQLWRLEPAGEGPGAAPVLEYNEHLKTEMLEGMGIPREVVEAAETGSGYSGRAVPLEAFDSTLQDVANWTIYDFDEQIIRPLVRFNYGVEATHDITPFGLARGSETQAELESADNNPNQPASRFQPRISRTPFSISSSANIRSLFDLCYWNE